ncbi:Receptor-like protein 12, partial [Mucuna pruriens]
MVAYNLLEGELELDKFLMLKMLVQKIHPMQAFLKFKQQCQFIPQLDVGKNKSSGINCFPQLIDGKNIPLMCNLKSLTDLDLSFNNLSGTVPSCLGSSSQPLQILVLKGNKLFDPIPHLINALRMVDLSNNNLQDQLPKTLVNCRMLEVIDAGIVKLMIHSRCLVTLPELKVVALSDNHLYGSIRCPTTCTFPKLHIVVLSRNQFTGSLPFKTIKNWKSMKASSESQLQYEDYSNNALMIPDVIGHLTSLVLLNLSNNVLSGNIPSSFGKLSNLEIFDLSLNSLSGKIPQQLAQLTFLSYFNASFNKLSGLIHKLSSLVHSKVVHLRITKDCVGIHYLRNVKTIQSHLQPLMMIKTPQDFFTEFDWKVVLIGYGGGLVAGVALGRTFGQEVLEWLKR